MYSRIVPILVFFSVMFAVLFFSPTPVHAATASMQISPSTGTFDPETIVPIQFTITGDGRDFNTAKATIMTSSLTVQDVTIGDCPFSFLKTPSVTDLSFTGVMLGTSRKSCSVFTAHVRAATTGTGTISLKDAEVVTATEHQVISPALTGGTYTFSLSVPASEVTQIPTGTSTPTPTPTKTYDVQIAVDSSIPATQIILQNTSDKSTKTIAAKPTENNQPTTFRQIPEGVYQVVVKTHGDTVIAKNVLTVSGDHRLITLGIHSRQPISYVLIICITLLLLIPGALALFRHRKPRQDAPPASEQSEQEEKSPPVTPS